MANWKSIIRKVKSSPKTKKVATKIGKEVFEREKKILLENFVSHPVSEEIQAGPNAYNESGTLNGYGNLFSFIGFSPGSRPVEEVLHLLKMLTKFKKVKTNRGIKNSLEIIISIPTMEDFKASTPMPWESGKSWVLGIERGISGFGSYMYEKSYNNKGSRSGAGVQAKKAPRHDVLQKIRPGNFKNVKYMSDLIRKFYERLRKQE